MDKCLQLTIQAVTTGQWGDFNALGNHRTLEARRTPEVIHNVRNELTATEDAHLLRDHHLVIPESLSKKVVQLAHVWH